MPPIIRGRLNLDSEDDAFDGVFSDPGQRSRLSQMQVEALRRAATRQPRNAAVRTISNTNPSDMQPGNIFDSGADDVVFANFVPSDTSQVRRAAGSVTSSADFQDFLNQNGGAAGVLKSAASDLFNQQLSKLKSIPGQLKPNEEKVNYLKGIAADVVNAIRGPLGYNNPTVAVGSPLAGQTINPEALNWIREQEKIKPIGQLDAMGGVVKAENYGPGNQNIIDIAFRNPVGFAKPSYIENKIKELKRMGPKGFAAQFGPGDYGYKDALASLEDDLNKAKGNPLMPEAIRYQLGRVIDNAPEGTVLQASPIGGAKGERARAYRMLSKGALETADRFKPDYSRVPSETEFRAASLGGGSRSIDNFNRNADLIKTIKTGPQEFVTAIGKPVTWNPAELKDPMIRAAFNLDKKADVSALRADPTSQFLNKGFVSPQGYIDFNKAIITPNSPLYRTGRGIVNASKVGLTDFIPSREVVSNLYNNQPLEAVRNYATEFIGGVPQALAVGGAVAAAPILAPVATALGGGMAVIKTGNAIDEAYRQATGKSWRERNQPASSYSTYTGPTPTIQPRMGTAILNGKPVAVPYGSVAGERKVGRPWWDKTGSQFQNLLNSFSPIIGR
jgi:hypothetical protein